MSERPLSEDLIVSLDRQAWEAQASIRRQGRVLIANWLKQAQEQGQYLQAADWLLGNEADRYFHQYREVLAVAMLKDVLHEFDQRENRTHDIHHDMLEFFDLKLK